MIWLLLAHVARAEPFDFFPIAVFEADAFYQPDHEAGNSGFRVPRAYLGALAEPVDRVQAGLMVNLAGERPTVLDAFVSWEALEWLSVIGGHGKTPLFPSARDQAVDAAPLPELPMVVDAFWPLRDTGAEAYVRSAQLPIEARLRMGNGSGTSLGNDNPHVAGDGRFDVVTGRQQWGAEREETYGLRLGVGLHAEEAADRGGISGLTITGFEFWHPPTVSGFAWVAEAHAVVDAGPVRIHVEGALAEESRVLDTDGDPDTAREELDRVASQGLSLEVAWMVTGDHRLPGIVWPIARDLGRPAVEVTGRSERLQTGRGADDVEAGGAYSVAAGAKVWFPFGIAVGPVCEFVALDEAPVEMAGDTFIFTALGRLTWRLR